MGKAVRIHCSFGKPGVKEAVSYVRKIILIHGSFSVYRLMF